MGGEFWTSALEATGIAGIDSGGPLPTPRQPPNLRPARRTARLAVEFAAHAADGKLVRLFRLS
jgi:hypothetical protein